MKYFQNYLAWGEGEGVCIAGVQEGNGQFAGSYNTWRCGRFAAAHPPAAPSPQAQAALRQHQPAAVLDPTGVLAHGAAPPVPVRAWLRQHRWRRLGQVVSVENDGRDLGAHYNVAKNKRVGTTLTQRMRKSSSSVVRLKMRRMPYAKKGQIIRMII